MNAYIEVELIYMSEIAHKNRPHSETIAFHSMRARTWHNVMGDSHHRESLVYSFITLTKRVLIICIYGALLDLHEYWSGYLNHLNENDTRFARCFLMENQVGGWRKMFELTSLVCTHSSQRVRPMVWALQTEISLCIHIILKYGSTTLAQI